MNEVPAPFTTGTLRRRAPFGDNPDVGTRGTQTQERILRAALEVFEEAGYHDCGVDRITAKAKCSRPSFYQYFSSKEDLFRRLSGDLARELFEVAGAPERITPDEDGWKALRALVEAYGDLNEVYAPVFAVFSTAVASDDVVADGAARVLHRQATKLLDRIDRRAFRTRRAEEVVLVLLNGVVRTHRFRRVLEPVDVLGLDRARVGDALTDVLHRSLFGQQPGVNVRAHLPMSSVAPPARSSPSPLVPPPVPAGSAGRRTRSRLLDAGREVFAARGFHDARVDDIVELAETSHGTFYRYFENKQSLFRILAARSGLRVVRTVEALPPEAADPSGDGASKDVRRWLRRYFDVYRTEGPIIRAWVEAQWGDPELKAASPTEVDELRRRLARFLAPRGFGDVDADALVLMGLLDRSEPVLDADLGDENALVDAFALVLQRGLLPGTG
jgi:AcrR family transcriptional regulator